MRILLISLSLVFALGACGDDKKEPTGPVAPAPDEGAETSAPTPVEPEAPAEPAAETPPAETPPAEPDATCVAECVQRNQMKAVAAEQIEADCKAECTK